MKIFISWSGERGRSVALALQALLVATTPYSKEDIFVSSQLEKGVVWSAQIRDMLRAAKVGIICVTPERLNSPWLHFEAGALTQHILAHELTGEEKQSTAANHPGLYTYLHGVKPNQVSAPLSAYQSTTSTKEDTFSMILSITRYAGQEVEEPGWIERFNVTWEIFEKALRDIVLKVPELLPEFESWFSRKTFNEPLQQCTAQYWIDRYNGARETYLKLKSHQELVKSACASYQVDLYQLLLSHADAYTMDTGLLLKLETFPLTTDGEVDIKLPGVMQACERSRKAVNNTVSLILDPLRIPKTDEAVRFAHSETFEQKKLLVHRIEFKFKRLEEGLKTGDKTNENKEALNKLLDAKELSAYRESPWELDRIYYYIFIQYFQECPLNSTEDALDAIRIEMETLRSKIGNPSLMTLSYALGYLEVNISKLKDKSAPANLVKCAVNDIEAYINEAPYVRDRGYQIRNTLRRTILLVVST